MDLCYKWIVFKICFSLFSFSEDITLPSIISFEIVFIPSLIKSKITVLVVPSVTSVFKLGICKYFRSYWLVLQQPFIIKVVTDLDADPMSNKRSSSFSIDKVFNLENLMGLFSLVSLVTHGLPTVSSISVSWALLMISLPASPER